MKKFKLFMFYMKELSLKKYIWYVYRKFMGKMMDYIVFNPVSNLSYIFFIMGMLCFFRNTDIELLRKTYLNIAYGRGWYKGCQNENYKQLIAEVYNETV